MEYERTPFSTDICDLTETKIFSFCLSQGKLITIITITIVLLIFLSIFIILILNKVLGMRIIQTNFLECIFWYKHCIFWYEYLLYIQTL